MRILLLDIETAPNKVYAWGMWDQNIGTNQVIGSGYVLCWSAKWHGENKIMFGSIQHGKPKTMLGSIHKLLDEAHVVVHYNGIKFDIPTLNKEFIKHGFKPPSPFKQVDLYRICRSSFRFESNKLDYVSQALAIGAKMKHEGFELWVKCMDGNKDAWKRMERYNRQDVRLLETLYDRLLPWIEKHPTHGAHDDSGSCPKCGSEEFQHRGYAYTTMMKYRRYQCMRCFGWFRGNKTASPRIQERMTNIAS
jgi:DNA polymerase elongation subunit (family B)